jgi:hypothetical protein
LIKLDPEEKDYIEKIAAISGESIPTVKNVFRGLLSQVGLQARANNNRIVVPYICSIEFSTKYPIDEPGNSQRNEVALESEPTSTFRAEVLASKKKGSLSPAKEWFRKRISEKISTLMK